MSTFEADRLDREWVDARLEAYLDGELAPEEARRLEARLAVDQEASEQLRLAQMVRRELSAIETPVCPPELIDAVIAEASSDAQRAAVPQRRRVSMDQIFAVLQGHLATFRSTLLRPSLATAALAILVVTAAVIGRTTRPSDDVSVSSATETANPASTGDLVARSAEPGPGGSGTAGRNFGAAEAAHGASDSAPRAATEPVAEPPVDALAPSNGPETLENPPSSEGPPSPEVRQALQEAKWALAFVSDVGREAGQSIGRDVFQDRVTRPIRRALDAALAGEPTS